MKSIMRLKKSIATTMIYALFLSSCAAGGIGGHGAASSSNPPVGPAMSSVLLKETAQEAPVAQRTRLDIIIPVFDPGLPKDPEKYEEAGIWPELRRAEASRFAYKMKLALEKTEVFGAVRVMPDANATGDLYIIGSIEESNGQTVSIHIKAYDIRGKKWFNASFTHEIKQEFYNNIRNKGKDPYEPVFQQASERLVKALDKFSDADLASLQQLATLRFGANFSEETFAQHIQIKRGIASLISYPSDDDIMLRRVQSIRIRDQLFIDRMQPHYAQFNQNMDDSYAVWQQQNSAELVAKDQARRDMISSALTGIALIGLSVFSAIAGGQSGTNAGSAAGSTGAILGGMAGIKFLEKSFHTSEEAKFHREALAELGQSIDSEMAPQVVEFEKSTEKLSGNAKEQFSQWRSFLKKIYAQEATPDVQL